MSNDVNVNIVLWIIIWNIYDINPVYVKELRNRENKVIIIERKLKLKLKLFFFLN